MPTPSEIVVIPPRLPLIDLRIVTLRAGGVDTFPNTSWQLRAGEIWVVAGPTGSGKSLFLNALAGNVPTSAGEIHYRTHGDDTDVDPADGAIGIVSPEQHRALASRALDFLQARWSPREGSERFTVRDLLHAHQPDAGTARLAAALKRAGVQYLLNRDLAALSNGEFRRVLFARALLTRPRVLLLDDPFAGLDTAARAQLQALLVPPMSIVMTAPRREDLPQVPTHLLTLDAERITYAGPFTLKRFLTATRATRPGGLRKGGPRPIPRYTIRVKAPANAPIIDMRGVTVRYGRFTALDNIDWRVNVGEKWVLRGPNGAGKTTLTNLILADHPQGYQNEIYLFGQRRGTGESIWDIKARIGWMAPELQYTFPGDVPALSVVTSGLHDALGLNFLPTRAEATRARQWLRFLEVDTLATRPFGSLSDGEQRLVLLARALVKQPPLLILDEPSQGLDRPHRALLHRAVTALARIPTLTLLLITHLDEDIPKNTTHELRLERGRAQVLPRS